jgi:hypothetical protein
MTIPMWFLLAGIFLPSIWAFASLPFRLKQFGEVDFLYPRRQGEKLVDAGSSVVSAQFNALGSANYFWRREPGCLHVGARCHWLLVRGSNGLGHCPGFSRCVLYCEHSSVADYLFFYRAWNESLDRLYGSNLLTS